MPPCYRPAEGTGPDLEEGPRPGRALELGASGCGGKREAMSLRYPLQLTPDGPGDPPRTNGRPSSAKLIDSFGRVHNNLRISVTDRCNLRCTYCMPEEVTFRPKDELLTFEEIVHFVRVATPLGVNKIRLTGGEPLVRRDLHKLVALLAAIPGIADLGLTTNGL